MYKKSRTVHFHSYITPLIFINGDEDDDAFNFKVKMGIKIGRGMGM